ncbi:MAG: hypothetical protein NVS1B10_07700 [Candidatus Saccharimonadales bacterium]
MKTLKSENGFAPLVLVFLVVAVVGGVGFYIINKNNNINNNSISNPVRHVKRPGIIVSEKFSTSIDASNAAISPTTKFTSSTPKIYVSLGLKNAKISQKLEYTRYLNGKYVDKGSIPVPKDGAKYASFIFDLKQGKTHPAGKYIVKTYTNGVYEKSASYKVQ